MKDTNKDVEKKFFELIMAKTGEERIKMSLEMFELTKKSVIASILNDHNKDDISEAEMKILILKRIYGDALSSETEQDFMERALKGKTKP